ncbi:aldose 1-epimerase family protein [candidate division KSB1 bacterium]|nr:aldose 1-epimerase family protein [candidate division KSB1 bacterium]
MAFLFGRQYSRTELLQRVGDMSQIGDVRPVELVDGSERGVRAMRFNTGSGLEFLVLADRALDIASASFCGIPLGWQSPTGWVAPAFYDSLDLGWLWSMGGGLMVTCGLTHTGPPELDGEEELGLHGRISNIPSRNVAFGSDWENDDYILWVSGEVRESHLFGPNMVLKRMIYARLGESKIWVKDVVENKGFEPSPLMLLYHCNVGFPLVDAGSELLAVVNSVEARDKTAARGVDVFDRFEAPTPGYEEQVFFIDHDTDSRGQVQVALVNRSFAGNQGIGLYLAYPKTELSEYTEWKMMGQGAYVVGMEPGNCRPEGRTLARRRGVLEILQPGESRSFHLEIGVLDGNEAIHDFENCLLGQDEEPSN